MSKIAESDLTHLKAMLGPKGSIETPSDKAPFLSEWRDKYHGTTPLILRPATVDEVIGVVRYCNEKNIPLVPQGGNTGLVGGQLPFEDCPALLLNLSRLAGIRAKDSLNNTITVDAGVTLQQVQDHADDMDRFFPLSLASEGSCQIGGNISTNAGGTAVLRYGNMRDLVLGLEVVLPNGKLWNGLTGLRKDNTGYDLKQLFIGAEGTLGVITGACLKLFPRPLDRQTAFVALGSVAHAIELLRLSQGLSGDLVSGFELIPQIGLDFVLRHGNNVRAPLTETFPWYVLIDVSGGHKVDALKPVMEAVMETGFEQGLILDAVMAQSDAERTGLWQLREQLSEVQKAEGGSIKHDIAVPVSAMPAFIDEAMKAVLSRIPGARPVPFGHVGDGNVHFNISQPIDMDRNAFLDHWTTLSREVHDIAVRFGGSISAEHGIGILKKDELKDRKAGTPLQLMHSIKAALDPKGLMNPGKIL